MKICDLTQGFELHATRHGEPFLIDVPAAAEPGKGRELFFVPAGKHAREAALWLGKVERWLESQGPERNRPRSDPRIMAAEYSIRRLRQEGRLP